MIETREQVIDMIRRGGGDGLKLLNMEKKFGIEFNAAQYLFTVNRAWGKSYLSYANALYDAIESGDNMVTYITAKNLDEDIDGTKRRIIHWMDRFQEFADSVGYETERVEKTMVKVIL